MRTDPRGGRLDPLDRGPQRARDIDAGALGLAGQPPRPTGQAGGTPHLVQQGLPFTIGPLGPIRVTGPVSRVQFVGQLADAPFERRSTGVIQHRLGRPHPDSDPAGDQVERRDVPAGGTPSSKRK